MNVVIVPAWRRADFLLACLTRIEIAAEGRDLELWISLDRGHTGEVLQVAESARAKLGARIRHVEHAYHGNSYNILTAYQEAFDNRPCFDLVHLIEEDILVGADYFDYHERAHALCPDALAVSACVNQNVNHVADAARNESLVWRHGSYQSLGVSFRPWQLGRVLVHVRPQYFVNPVAYCRSMFPSYPHDAAFAEQDGLIRRVGHACNLPTVYPVAPRAYHAGFHGYNRKGQKLAAGSVGERSRKILAMDAAALNSMAKSDPDHYAIDLDAPRAPVTGVLDHAA